MEGVRLALLLLGVTWGVAWGQQSEDSNLSDSQEEYRGNIPSYISPIMYSIGLKINLRDWVYSGRTQVLVNISESCDEVVIHAAGLDISEVFMATFDEMEFGSGVQLARVVEDPREQLLRIYPRHQILPGVFILIIDFENSFADDFWGFYKTSWEDEKGSEHRMVSTQFSPYWARTAWPCYDEPRFKVRFKFFVEHESEYRALSNGEVESRTTTRPGWVRTTFQWTPDMSTYITAMIITNYRYVEVATSYGLPVRVYGPPNKLKHIQPLLSGVTRTLEFLEEYFGVDYAMNKLDLVPIKRIGVAAMENWGLITAREDIANYEPAVHSATWELHTKVILSHEVAHMWFGNLVTPHWWDHIILKESTVSWLMVFAADQIYGDFDYADEYAVLYEVIRGMDKDSRTSSRPAITNPNNQAEIMNMFDEITYQRGGCLFRMLYHILGPASFQLASHNYLARHAYSTAEMGDYTRLFQEAASQYDIKSLIERYTLQKNHPLVEVSMLNKTHVLVKQERFLYNYQEAVEDSIYNYTWHIPFTYTTDVERNDKVVILTEKENIVKLGRPAQWIKVNNDFRMYYVTNYDVIGWKKLYHQLLKDHTVFTTSDRIQLLSDMLSMVTADRLDITFPLQFLQYLKKEREFGPWKVAAEHWNGLMENKMSPAEKFAAKIYARDLIDEVLKEVVELDTSYLKPLKERLLQFLIVDTAMKVEHPLAQEFIEKVAKNTTRVEALDPGIDYLVRRSHAQSDPHYWAELFERLPTLTDPDTIQDTYTVLATTRNSTLLEALLRWSLSSAVVKDQQNLVTLLSETEPDLTWRFFSAHYDTYFEVYGESQFLMTFMIQTVTQHLATPESYKEVQLFFQQHDPGTGAPGLMYGLEQITENIRWRTNHRHKCRNFFFTYARRHAKRQKS